MKFIGEALKNAFKNILRNKLVNFLCLGIIAFTLLVLGIFNTISFQLSKTINKLSENIEAIFYLKDDANRDQVEALIQKVQASLLTREIKFTSKDEAEAKFVGEFPELTYIVKEFDVSPFPSSIGVKFRQNADAFTQIESFVNEIRNSDIIESVQLNVDWAKKISMAKRFVYMVGAFLTFILLFVSIFVIFNVIKLNIFYRQDEITIFELVGATRWYVRSPFLIEGFLLGLLGGILAGLLLFLTLRILTLYRDSIWNLIKQFIDFRRLPLKIYLQLVLIGPLIGLFSAALSLKRFLKAAAVE